MAMIDIAQNHNEQPTKLEKIAERQAIALNYLEQIFGKLRQKGLVTSVKGPGGGYILNNRSDEITIASIILAVEESLTMTRCSKTLGKSCIKDNSKCLTHDLWEGLGNSIYNYLNKITISDVCNNNILN